MRVSRFTRLACRDGLGVVAAMLLLSATVSAQDAPAHLAYVDGAVSLDREGESLNATRGEPLLPGDRLRTGSGLVEVWFPDGAALDLDTATTAELGSPSFLRLTEGQLILLVPRDAESASVTSYQIETPWGSVVTNGPGEYRVSLTAGLQDGTVALAVVRGIAQLTSDRGSVDLRAGERALAGADAAPSRPEAFNAARMDSFARWAADRRSERLARTTSSRYLPTNLQMYGSTFDRYGVWENDAANGYAWYPTVDPGWRPYYNGYWSPLRTYGWTWIGLDLWGWPTHHYGRWGFARSRWFWVPERRFAPAWVSWATAPDYVSWCPIGLDNRPVFNLAVPAGNNWAGWVVLPRASFGARHLYVSRYAVEGRRLPRNTTFIAHSQVPLPPSFRGRENVAGVRTGGLGVPGDSRGAAGHSREALSGGRLPSASPRADRDIRATARDMSAPLSTETSPGGRAGVYRGGPERQSPERAASDGAPRAYGPRPAMPRDRQMTSRDGSSRERDAAVPDRAAPRDPQSSASGRYVPRYGQAGPSTRDVAASPQPVDRAPGSRRAYSPAVAGPAAPVARPSPRADRGAPDRGGPHVPSGNDPNRRSGAVNPTTPRSSPPPRPAERASRPPESARPAPARQSPTPRAEPRAGRSPGEAGAARSRDGGHDRRSR